MVTPISLTIPTLKEDQTLAEYEPLFCAAVSTLTVTEEGRKAVIRLLPAYVGRREVERVVALEAIKKDTLDEAFKVLKDHLDPPVDVYQATRRYYRMDWSCGEQVNDYFVKMWKEARLSGHSTRHACVNMVSQLPPQIQQTAKAWMVEKHPEGDVSDEAGRSFMVKIRAVRVHQRGSEKSNRPRTSGRQNEFRCFTCGRKEHGWRKCPDNVCGNCGQKGHPQQNCWKQGNSNAPKGRRKEYPRAYVVGQDITDEEIDCIDDSEDSVTLAVNIEGKRSQPFWIQVPNLRSSTEGRCADWV